MNKVEIKFEICKECDYCITFCPKKEVLAKGADINLRGYYPPAYYAPNCTGCGICAIVCPEAAIEVFKDVM